ncbi:MAG: methyl-accepting chemotaxis protein [Pseudomonadota bacterium]
MSTAVDHVAELAKAQEEKKRFRVWFESAMMMVDNTPAPLMWANAEQDFCISYMNTAGRKSLKALSDHTGVSPKDMDGAPLGRLFGAQASTLPNLSDSSQLPWQSRVVFGTQTLDFQIRAILDRKEQYCGAMITWSDVTDRVNLIQSFEDDVYGVANEIGRSADQLMSSAEIVRSGSRESAQGAEQVSGGINSVSANLNDLASAGETLVTAVAEIGKRGKESSDASQLIAQQAGNADEKVKVLAEGTSQIGEVLRLITEIANQTNLLALNATIEAARAGEAGRGFAVVAKEVKSLSNKTSEAISNIEHQIRAIETATSGAVAALAEIRESIGSVTDTGEQIGSAVDEQSHATDQIQSLISEIRRLMQDVARHTQGATQRISSAGQASESLHVDVGDLREVSERLRSQVENFLAAIRGGGA